MHRLTFPFLQKQLQRQDFRVTQERTLCAMPFAMPIAHDQRKSLVDKVRTAHACGSNFSGDAFRCDQEHRG